MFRAITSAIGSLWSSNEQAEDCNTVQSQQHSHTDAQLSVISERNIEKQYDGKVTSTHSGYGLIDNHIYFDFNVVKGAVPRIGDAVHVIATKKHETAGWKAAKVTVADVWEKNNESGEEEEETLSNKDKRVLGTESIVGRVTKVEGDSGFINGNISFKFEDTVDLYTPYRGDWVKADVSTDAPSDKRMAFSVEPLRRWDTEGQVDVVLQGFGFISSHTGSSGIYFAFGALCEHYEPRKGDRVKVSAIEVSGNKNSWRAIRVEPAQEIDKLACLNRVKKLQIQSPSSAESRIAQLLTEKEGIYISGQADFAQITLLKHKTLTIWITNGGSEVQTLVSYRPFSRASESQFSIEPQCHHDTSEIDIQPGSVLPVSIICKARNLGADKQLLLFEFSKFKIATYAMVNVTDPNQLSLDASTPYQRNRVSQQNAVQYNSNTNRWIIQGQRPQSKSRTVTRLPVKLLHYEVPEKLWNCVFNKQDLAGVEPQLGESLCMRNYTARFSVLLHLEEIQQDIDMCEFDLQRVCLRHCGEYLTLAVPGLAEGRPSVLVGDKIYLSTPGDEELGPQYQGFVHEVRNEDILLKFHDEFHSSYGGEDYNVRFVFNRTPMRRCHQAVEFAPCLGKQVLFPTELIPKVPQISVEKNSPLPQSQLVKPAAPIGVRRCPLGRRHRSASGPKQPTHKFFNSMLNVRQRSAVLRILSAQCRPTPYLLFGPPGTGKTVTLVEAILQVFHHIPSSRIIACAPSNSASDLLAERLYASGLLKRGDLARLNAFRRTEGSIPACIRDICSDGEDLELVSRHRIVVCTCTSAGLMYSLDLLGGHFTHTFIDEAGQATEPEAMIAVGLVGGADGQVVLAGDPMQLGAVLRSKQAKLFGLDLSLLERLIYSDLYARDENKFSDHGSYDPLLVTKLVENYRSHPVLLGLSSRLFYHDELLVSAQPSLIECLTQWELLPNKNNFPLIFHGLRGEDMREGNSPSWFNSVEALQVMMYLKSLVNNTTHKLTFDDIGIITPYRKQVEKIRLLIDKLGMEKVKVGSVEEFQGQERLVMIISTVRSKETQVPIDIRHNLGFLSNPKRFNVSITRAQALLIIVGNPHVLYRDPMWRELIIYCVKNNAYTGCDLPDLEIDDENDAENINRTDDENAAVEDINAPQKDSNAAARSPFESKDEVHSVDSQKSETPTPSDLSQSVLNDRKVDVNLSKPLIAKDINNIEQKSASPARSKKMPCAKFIAQSSSPSPIKTWENPKTQYKTTYSVQRTTADEVQGKSGFSLEVSDVTEKALPKPQREPRVRLISKNRKRRERTIFDRVPRRDNDTDSDSNCSRDWFPTMDEWLLTDQSENSTQADSQSDQSMELIGKLSTLSTSNDQSEKITNSPDQSNLTVDEMLNKLMKESQLYREQHSCERIKPSNEKKNGTKREKGRKVERNLVPEAIFKNKEKITDTASDNNIIVESSDNLFQNQNAAHAADIAPSKDNRETVKQSDQSTGEAKFTNRDMMNSPELTKDVSDFSNTTEASAELELDESKSDVTDADESLTATENSFHDDLTKANDKDYKRLMKMCQAVIAEDPPTELEAKIIRQIEYYFGDYNLPKDKFLKDVMAKNDGWVPLKTVATFNKMKELTDDLDVIRTALRKSPNQIVQISLGGHMISRSSDNPLPTDTQQWKRNLQDKCIYVEGLPAATASLETLEEYFQKWGGVYHIEMPRVGPFQHQTAAVVVFKDASSVKDVLRESHVYQNHRLSVSYRSDAVGLLSKNRRAKSSVTKHARDQDDTKRAYKARLDNKPPVVVNTKNYTRYGESRETQRGSGQYKIHSQRSHGSRDDPSDHVIQHPAAPTLEQRPRRAPRSSRSQSQVDPWATDDTVQTDRFTGRQDSLKKLQVNIKNTRSNCTGREGNLTSHILENMDVDQLSSRQNSFDLDFNQQKWLEPLVHVQEGREAHYEEHKAGKFPVMYTDVRMRDQIDSYPHSSLHKLPLEVDNQSGLEGGAQGVSDLHMYPDDLAQGDSDVIVESSDEEEDEMNVENGTKENWT